MPYYRQINEVVKSTLGGLNSARIVLYSVNFHDIERLQRVGAWDEAGEAMAAAATALRAAGAECVVLCTNTMHRVSEDIERAVDIPLLHIADPTAEAAKKLGIKTIGLLGTAFTMEQAFYRERLESLHGLNVLVPDALDREQVHRIIYDELCKGHVLPESREIYRAVMRRLVEQGAEAIILGCTEISLLVSGDDATVPLLDTTHLHATAAAHYALAST